jgi:SAM-dependent methyltransferase
MTKIPDLEAVIADLPRGSRVTDIGCFGWSLARACAKGGHILTGVDRAEPPHRPEGARFATMQGAQLTIPDDCSDLTVASHVLEHQRDPVELFGELSRVTESGGLIWIESPSELSAGARGDDDAEAHRFTSFWDDPTHVRPFTPGALYRLALSWKCTPLHCGRGQHGDIPVARLLARKGHGQKGRTPYTFVSLKDVPHGLDAAWRHVWG